MMLKSLSRPDELAALVGAGSFLVAWLLLLAAIPTRRERELARRIAALRPAAPVSSSDLAGRLDRVMVAALPFSERVLGPIGQQQLRRIVGDSGITRRLGLLAFAAMQLVLTVFGGAIGWVLLARFAGENSLLHWGFVAVGALFGAYFPDVVLRKIGEHRLHEIELGIPDALDLMVICAEAGLSFESALERVAAELKHNQPALAAEFAATSAELRVLPERASALASLAMRVPLKSMETVTTTLIYSLKYGTPLAHALRVMAGTLRNEALLALEERAGKLPALMTIPMILFLLPATMFILVGPAALRIMDAFH
jgi:tight adherence protein C